MIAPYMRELLLSGELCAMRSNQIVNMQINVKVVKAISLSFLALGCVSAVNAVILVDGAYDADYGAAKAIVTYDPAAPTSNFGTPGPTNHTTA